MRRLGAALALAVTACAGPLPAEAPRELELGEPRELAFVSLDGEPVTSASLRGRMTVVGLVASYDTPSQAQARFLAMLHRRYRPRLNVLLLMLEPAGNEPLVRAFAEALDLGFPVAMADPATLAGRGAFPGLHHVPSVVLLDREGREVWRHLGLLDAATLAEEVAARDAQHR